MKMSVKWKIIGIVITIVIIGLSSLATISSIIISNKTEEGVVDQSRTIVQQLSTNVQTVLENYGQSLQMIAQSDEIENYYKNNATLFDEADDTLRQDFKTFLETYPNASGIYTADVNGLMYEPHFEGLEDIDATTRPWYELGMKNPDVVSWTEPYLDAATNTFTITGVTTVKVNNKVIGVLAADILLTNLTDMVSAMELGYDGYTVIFDRTGFAVVADEVRKLAEQSADATEVVKKTITELQNQSHHVTVRMNQMKQSFNESNNVVNTTSEMFAQLSNLIEQVNHSFIAVHSEIDNVNKYKDRVLDTIEKMSMNSQTAAAACEEVSASTDEQLHAIQSVAQASEELNQLSTDLAIAVSRFKV